MFNKSDKKLINNKTKVINVYSGISKLFTGSSPKIVEYWLAVDNSDAS